jgi:hypothetical protein
MAHCRSLSIVVTSSKPAEIAALIAPICATGPFVRRQMFRYASPFLMLLSTNSTLVTDLVENAIWPIGVGVDPIRNPWSQNT